MDGTRDHHTKWGKSDWERQIYDITYKESKKNDTNTFIYKAETESQTYRTNLVWGNEG